MYFVHVFRKLPIFGRPAADHWLWTAGLSPSFFGQGVITGPAIPLHMLIGAIIGWGFLSPLAKHQGWAPGEVDDWENGSRFQRMDHMGECGGIRLLADASIKLSWFFLRPFWR
jgi:OPT oligopeptide transporter protein